MQVKTRGRFAVATLAAATSALAVAASAGAHAHISPPVVQAGEGQVFTLAVPTEKEGVTTTSIELTPPEGFAIDDFLPSPGWKRTVEESGSGEEAVATKVTWTGGNVPTGEATPLQFLAEAESAQTYELKVRQTYSDGTIVDWSGSPDSDTPATELTAVEDLGGGGGGSSTLAIVALVVGALGVVIGLVALLSGKRSLA